MRRETRDARQALADAPTEDWWSPRGVGYPSAILDLYAWRPLWIFVACAAGAGCVVVSPGARVTAHKAPAFGTLASPRPDPDPDPEAVTETESDAVQGAAPASPTPSALVDSEPEPDVDVADPADDAEAIHADVYGALDDPSCFALLKKRDIPYVKVPEARGVETPIRLTGLLHGVDFHGGETKEQRATSPNEILDCRLALALDDFAEILEQQGVVEAVHWSIYRAPPVGADPKKTVDHPAGLAMDLGAFIEKDGSRTGVAEDWHGEIGAKTCGKGAYLYPETKRAWRLRAILCFTAKARFFNLILTPNFNAAHHDHFHLEIKRNSKFSFVQ